MKQVSQLMPQGKPDFTIIRQSKSIVQMLSEDPDNGYNNLQTALCILIQDFCDSVNVPEAKNMNQSQIIEAAAFLLDESGNYRIEDYVMMFTMAKRGKLEIGGIGRIFDRVDIQLISDFKSNYELLRRQGEDFIRDMELKEKEKLKLPDPRDNPDEPEEIKIERFNKVLDGLKELRDRAKEDGAAERAKTKKLQQELLHKIEDKAKEDGYTGPIIDLSEFKHTKK